MRYHRAVGLVVLAIALAITGLEVWTRQPVARPVPALDLPSGVQTLVLVIHGSADADNPLLAEIVAALAARYRDVPGAAVRFVRWAPESDERLRAAATARAVGRDLGTLLAGLPALGDLILVAHSSGAFMPDAICAAWRQGRKGPARVTMTLLDPFQIDGFVDWTYGSREQGTCADFALAVINTDDPAPATNRFLARAWNLDVTAHPGRAAFDRNGHYWPLRYYRDFLLDQQPEIGSWTFADHPAGAVIRDP